MKKLTLVMLAVLTILIVAVCVKENTIDEVREIEPIELYREMISHGEKLKGNTYKVTGIVYKVEKDHVKTNNIIVYFTEDELAEIKEGDEIVFIGTFCGIKQEITDADELEQKIAVKGELKHLTIYAELKGRSFERL